MHCRTFLSSFGLQRTSTTICLIGILLFVGSADCQTRGPKYTTKSQPAQSATATKMALCIVNCSQCEDLLGLRFDHRRCAKDCLERKGAVITDCTVPSSVQPYMKLWKRSSFLWNPSPYNS